MTSEIELRYINFMKKIAASTDEVEEKLLKPATKDVEHFIRKLYEDDPNKPFTMRMSNLGRPLCQLQMEQAKAARVENDWNLPLRLIYGGVIEGLCVNILRHANVGLEEEQTQVSFMLAGHKINGTLDIIIKGKVYDIKSASSYSFKEKFASYESLKASDDFGYITQLALYSAASGAPMGGWVVIDKSSGDFKVVEVPDEHQADKEAALRLASDNVRALTSGRAFKQCFSDEVETYRRKETNNRTLCKQCTYCPFRYSCWKGLQYLPSACSTAYEKPHKYYTEYHENIQPQS